MKKEVIIGSLAGVIVGGLLVGMIATLAVNNNNQTMMKMMGMHATQTAETSNDHMGMSMDQMSEELKNRTGDDFDSNFISMMIAHHQGAIDMAALAAKNAKHQEVKDLSQEIITAQTQEIEAMKQWQQQWGYSQNDSSTNMHAH